MYDLVDKAVENVERMCADMPIDVRADFLEAVAARLDASVDGLRSEDWDADIDAKLLAATTDHVRWCRQQMSLLAEGGVWEVPRSLLTYRKRGNALVLTARGKCPTSLGNAAVADWQDYQNDDHANNKRNFEAAGFTVLDESTKP